MTLPDVGCVLCTVTTGPWINVPALIMGARPSRESSRTSKRPRSNIKRVNAWGPSCDSDSSSHDITVCESVNTCKPASPSTNEHLVASLSSACCPHVKRGKRIGSGSSANVFIAQNRDTGELLALKELRLPSATDVHRDRRMNQLHRELKSLRSMRHPHVVEFKGSEVRSHKLRIFTEYLSGGSVQDALRAFGCFEEKLAARYTRHLLRALVHVHSQRLVHCDVKCANLLLDKDGRAKLADFGDTEPTNGHGWVKRQTASLRGTPRYLAPEIATGTHNGAPRDIWAVGCCLVYMLSGNAPWRHVPIHDVQKLMAFVSTTHTTPLQASLAQGLSADAVDFLNLTFTRNPVHRPSAEALLRHPFIARHAAEDVMPPLAGVAGVDEMVPPGTPVSADHRRVSQRSACSVSSLCSPRGSLQFSGRSDKWESRDSLVSVMSGISSVEAHSIRTYGSACGSVRSDASLWSKSHRHPLPSPASRGKIAQRRKHVPRPSAGSSRFPPFV